MFGVIIDNQYLSEDSYVYLKPSHNTDIVINNYNHYLGGESSYTSDLEMSEQTYERLKGEIDVSYLIDNPEEMQLKMEELSVYPFYRNIKNIKYKR
ncbi:hypothetical protein [Natranaerovirga hydrolytica]|nr:hypothetical protein [Natranaerovirga hydrolytica]